jgi:hypothetical protein
MHSPDEDSLDQIAWGLTWSLPAAKAQLALATDLMHRLPAVYQALLAGEIDMFRTRVFTRSSTMWPMRSPPGSWRG